MLQQKPCFIQQKQGFFTTFLSINTIKTKVLTNDAIDSNIILLIADEL